MVLHGIDVVLVLSHHLTVGQDDGHPGVRVQRFTVYQIIDGIKRRAGFDEGLGQLGIQPGLIGQVFLPALLNEFLKIYRYNNT
ncbi:hypothetical protein SDC9_161181 [bioreactor metagenome]|uniref:Uncharacterized protein n=1 Tax=bioreactor metagenome TaxID=1076179 RepID=A0A645FHE6_9ZZZZ